MPFTPPSKQPPESPSIPAEATPGSDKTPQHAAPDQAKEGVQEGAQSQSKDRARDLRFLSGLIQKFLISTDHDDNDVEIMLNVFQDRQACDTLFVCLLMSHVWGEFYKYDIARVIHARDGCKFSDDDYYHHFQVSMIAKLMEVVGSDRLGGEVKEIFGAKSQWKKWLNVEAKYILRGRKRDESDTEENAAWTIWSEAKAELEKLEKLDKMSVEAS